MNYWLLLRRNPGQPDDGDLDSMYEAAMGDPIAFREHWRYYQVLVDEPTALAAAAVMREAMEPDAP